MVFNASYLDSFLEGKKMVGKPKKYEFKEGKDKIAYF
jgi:hypothetical protein